MNFSLSIVVPVFNEEKRLNKTFSELEEFVKIKRFSSEGMPFSGVKNLEIIFVDDGSTDRTKQIIENLKSELRISLISYRENKGKGYAVRRGMLCAKNDYALTFDADMSTSLEELQKMIPFVEKKYPVIIGTRKVKGAKMIPPQPFFRKKLGEAYTIFANLIMGVWVSDFTCGFKLFSREARDIIFPSAKIDRWSYDAEILYLAKKIVLIFVKFQLYGKTTLTRAFVCVRI